MAGRRVPRVITFDPESAAVDEIEDHMRTLLAARQGWVNLEPEVPDEKGDRIPSGATGAGIFSNKGPAIPLCTWTAPRVSRKGAVGPQSIGVQHAVGSKARPHLRSLHLEVPEGWVVRGDNPKRGMVVELPSDTDVTTVLDWLLAAGEALATVPLTGRWFAAIYQ